MVPLGWAPGVIGLILAAAISLYANMLIAKLHVFGGKRHIRYRDLAGHIYGRQLIRHATLIELDHLIFAYAKCSSIGFAVGRKAYSLTWGLQYVNLFMINTGFIILAGSALKVKNLSSWPSLRH